VFRARTRIPCGGIAKRRVAVLCGVLFLSGTGALIFETLWLRLSGLAFGNSIWATAADSLQFHGGSGVGKRAGCIVENPAMAAAAFLPVLNPRRILWLHDCFGLPILGDLMRPVWQALWNYQPTLLGLRFVISFLDLARANDSHGLTLPCIIEDPLLRATEFGRAIGFLYGSNTLGR